MIALPKNQEKKSHKKKLNDFGKHFSLALVEPEYPMNVGYVARTIANFGLTDLVIIGKIPDEFDIDVASRFASHGGHVMEKMRRLKSIQELKKEFDILIGTTAIAGRRRSNITRKTIGITECANRVIEIASGRKNYHVCFVLGRDTTGLTNEELRQCDYAATIQTGSDYNTLNVSHAAAIFLFAFCERLRKGSKIQGTSSSRNDSRKEKERVIALFAELAELSEFQEFKREKLREAVARLLNKSDPSLREIYLLMGLASRASSKIKRLNQTGM